ncbi:hypothetical protein OY671_003847 [Metschnikowia pulcherrima]|nr:hypothetical protein OY671_003847 [Metschnikowia pulcherrima]
MSQVESIEMSSRGNVPVTGTFMAEQRLSHRRGSVNPAKRPEPDSPMYSSESNPEDFPDGGVEAYTVLFGGFCGLIADFGIPNGMGAIEAYVSKNQLASLRPSTVSWIFSLHLGTMFFGGVFFGGLFDKYGAKRLLVAGTLLMFAGLMALAESTDLYQFILSFGIVTAVGCSLAMAPLMGVMSHWFLKKRAMACSIAMAGGLVGSSVFVIMLQRLYISVGYKWAIRVLAFVCLACMTVALVLVKERKSTRDLIETPRSTNRTERTSPDGTGITIPEPAKSWTSSAKRAFPSLAPLRDLRFVSLTLAVFLSELNSMTILTYLASFASAGGVAESKAYLLLTIVSVSGVPARLITGILADKYGRFNVMLITCAFSMIFIWALLTPSNGRLPYLYAFTVLFGISSAAVLSLVAACLGQICPASSFGRHYGVLYFCMAFLIILGMYFTSLVINTGSQHDYKMWIVFEGCISIGSVAAWTWARWCNVGFRVCKY